MLSPLTLATTIWCCIVAIQAGLSNRTDNTTTTTSQPQPKLVQRRMHFANESRSYQNVLQQLKKGKMFKAGSSGNKTKVWKGKSWRNQKLSSPLRDCYDWQFGNTEIDIFNLSDDEIAYRFFVQLYGADSPNLYNVVYDNLDVLRRLIKRCTNRPPQYRYRLGITSMLAYSNEDFQYLMNSYVADPPSQNSNYYVTCDMTQILPLPKSVDWTNLNLATTTDQDMCASAYIFAALEVIEDQNPILGYDTVRYSAQALLSCMDGGCNGDSIPAVWEYILDYSAPELSDYSDPYQGYPGECSDYYQSASITEYCYISPVTDRQIQILLNKYGPVAAAIDISNDEIKFAKGYFDGDCGTNVNHAVLVVGYTKDSWIIQNSWGYNWGDDGYFMLPRGENKCGINTFAAIAFVQ